MILTQLESSAEAQIEVHFEPDYFVSVPVRAYAFLVAPVAAVTDVVPLHCVPASVAKASVVPSAAVPVALTAGIHPGVISVDLRAELLTP